MDIQTMEPLVSKENIQQLRQFLKEADGWFDKTDNAIELFCSYWEKMCFRLIIGELVTEYLCGVDLANPSQVYKYGFKPIYEVFSLYFTLFETMAFDQESIQNLALSMTKQDQNSTAHGIFQAKLHMLLEKHCHKIAAPWGIELGEIKPGQEGPRGKRDIKPHRRLSFTFAPMIALEDGNLTILNSVTGYRYPIPVEYLQDFWEKPIGQFATPAVKLLPPKFKRTNNMLSEDQDDFPIENKVKKVLNNSAASASSMEIVDNNQAPTVNLIVPPETQIIKEYQTRSRFFRQHGNIETNYNVVGEIFWDKQGIKIDLLSNTEINQTEGSRIKTIYLGKQLDPKEFIDFDITSKNPSITIVHVKGIEKHGNGEREEYLLEPHFRLSNLDKLMTKTKVDLFVGFKRRETNNICELTLKIRRPKTCAQSEREKRAVALAKHYLGKSTLILPQPQIFKAPEKPLTIVDLS